MRRGVRWLRGEVRDRLLIRRGQNYGHEFPPLDGGAAPEPGWLESYFDAHAEGRGIWKSRHYFPIYERHLAHLRGRDAHLLEIGVFSGGSLQMWRDYLGPESQITGVDINPACQSYEADGISVVIGDQGNPTFWQRLVAELPALDAVIDDGSHRPEHQIVSLTSLLPHLRPGGIYICEDVVGPTNPFSRFVDGLARNMDAGQHEPLANHEARIIAEPFQRAITAVHRYPFVTVIERTAGPVTEFYTLRRGTEWEPFYD